MTNDILNANPHPDRYGNKAVWHFYSEPATQYLQPTIPSGSLVAQWQASSNHEERQQFADALETLLKEGTTNAAEADKLLYNQLMSLSGPLLGPALASLDKTKETSDLASDYGIQADRFGMHPDGTLSTQWTFV